MHGLIEHDAAGGDEDRPGIVHRLDRDTSGLLVVARSDEAHERLQEAIRRRRVERATWRSCGAAPLALGPDRGADRPRPHRPSRATRSTRRRRATRSPTSRCVELLGPRALLDVTLETGRTHQIRVHLEAIELPVSGDPVYGVHGDLGLERQFLHAAQARVPPPVHRRSGSTSSRRCPADLAAALERARELGLSGALHCHGRFPSVPATRTGGGAGP